MKLEVKEQEKLKLKMDKIHVVFEKDYERLEKKPKIEDVELIGNKSFEDLGIRELTNSDILALIGGKL